MRGVFAHSPPDCPDVTKTNKGFDEFQCAAAHGGTALLVESVHLVAAVAELGSFGSRTNLHRSPRRSCCVWIIRINEDNTMNSVNPEVADNIKREQRQRRMRRVSVVMGVFAACTGLSAYSRVAGNPRFETYHTLDVIRLMTAGAAFGVALVLLIQFFKSPGTRSEAKKE